MKSDKEMWEYVTRTKDGEQERRRETGRNGEKGRWKEKERGDRRYEGEKKGNGKKYRRKGVNPDEKRKRYKIGSNR